MVARARVAHTFDWLRALCGHARDGLHATTLLNPALWQHGNTVVLDASPWGGGGFLSVKGEPVTWFSTAWTAEDCRRLDIVIGDHRHQAVVEAYAILIGVRFWLQRWSIAPTVVLVKSDSIAALGSMERGGTTKNASLNLLLKELALVIATVPTGLRLSFRHLPGARNEWADALSRVAQPGSGACIPPPLLACKRTGVEARGDAFWITGQVPEEAVQVSNSQPEV